MRQKICFSVAILLCLNFIALLFTHQQAVAQAPAKIFYVSPQESVLLVESDDKLKIYIDNGGNHYIYENGTAVKVKISVNDTTAQGGSLLLKLQGPEITQINNTTINIPANGILNHEIAVSQPGYYEVNGVVKTSSGTVSSERTISFGIFPPNPSGFYDSHPESPFGFHDTRLSQLFPILGAKWNRTFFSFYSEAENSPRKQYLNDQVNNKVNNIMGFMPNTIPGHPARNERMDRPNDATSSANTPANWDTYFEEVKKAVAVFHPFVTVWEGMNEPAPDHKDVNTDIMTYWTRMKQVVGQYSPDKSLIGPTFITTIGPYYSQWLQTLYGLGLKNLIQGSDFHWYTFFINPPYQYPEQTGLIGYQEKIQQVNNVNGVGNFPLYITEMGYPTIERDKELWQAQYLVQAYMLGMRFNVKALLWYIIADNSVQSWTPNYPGFAIFRSNGNYNFSQPRPAGHAYGVMTRQLMGYRFAEDESGKYTSFNSNIRVYKFTKDNQPLWVVWSLTDAPTVLSLDIRKPVAGIVSMFGVTKISNTENGKISLTASSSPQYISGSVQELPSPTENPLQKKIDINKDGRITLSDYQLWIEAFLKQNLAQADLNGDNKINIFDANIMISTLFR